ncbi:MAG TPA: hypothetical protein VFZ36_03745 [Vicinamibacterales bacterium]
MAFSPQDAEIVRAFRRNAVHVRQALRAVKDAQHQVVSVVDGYIQDAGWIERYRRLSTPVRRAAMESDKASLTRALAAMERGASGRGGSDTGALAAARRLFGELQAELDSTVGLGGRKVARGEMFRAWMDAAVFYDSTDKQRPYEELVAAHGKAIESMSAELAERYAEAVIAADDAAAEALGEPVILPPPPKTPPPPPDPKEKGRWKRVFRSLLRRRGS